MLAIEFARKNFERTGQRLTCELVPQLMGKEGKRVEGTVE
jgi:hypothetical protein